MSLKQKMAMSMATALLGVSLISGGTYSYFNDQEETMNTFATGLLELGINKQSIIQMKDIVPGDTMESDFTLTNDGTIDMREIQFLTDYKVIDKSENNNGDNLADYIHVELLHHVKGKEKVVFQKKLSDLKKKPFPILDAFPTGGNQEKFSIRCTFVDNEGNQNHFQRDSIELTWIFETKQREGKSNVQ
ncbi:TasA family protein [Virgibacillus salexigens]|uniref:TasA family protein n=1 Tax=Virgibacillus massiliensis TaxID=1462526 RepID=UPI0013716518|nr:TasA family protein [Virgibacillus massiliensis]MYL40250.1 cell division protein FtsN [Virgibacillus massiliensis]